MDKKTITESEKKLSMKKRPMKTKHRRKGCFTHQQVTELISKAYSKNPRLACLWHLGYLTGLRLSELLELEWSQVNLEKGFLEKREKLPYRWWRMKSYLLKRYPLHGEVLEILEQMKSEDESKSNYLFPAWQGEKRMVVSRLNRKLIDSIGLGNGSHPDYFYTFHSLRASYFMRKRMSDTTTESNLIPSNQPSVIMKKCFLELLYNRFMKNLISNTVAKFFAANKSKEGNNSNS